ncbi:transcription elongation regulator 1 isoform X4 [Drosophila pseudoobscura]|uniref:Transcription elongation regulator 1 isoform X4 n=1 Tax=Drosophila pseudoobscura pseudoobscura TaxID=46245 RepID=A0A6I8V365_DROPS|nr:transcription elongation regulator 1 isoform X4 [Drosophila pseudoobscura]
METSLDESMDSERASSPVDFQEENQSPPGVALNINGNGSASASASQEGPNGVAIAKEKPTDVTWSKPFNAFSGRPIGEHSAQQQTLQQQALQQQQQQQQQPPTHHQQMPPPGANGVAAATSEIWVETKAEDGRSYYYHAVTRETTWTRPDGPTVKIMTQTEVEEIAKRPPNAAVKPDVKAGEPSLGSEMAAVPHLTSQPPPHLMSQPPPNAAGPLLSQPPPNVRQQPPPMFQPPGMQPPPGFGQPPFCMPPPAYGFPGGAAPGGPWGVGVPPWQQQQQQQQHMHAPPGGQDKPAKTLIIKPGVIDPAVIARAAEWSEHRAPDGRPYYYHAARGESVWEKPQALRDMEAARMAAHSGVAPAVGPPGGIPPHLLPNPMMHMPPGTAPPGFDPQMAYAAAAAAMKANTESAKASQAAALEKEAKKAAEEKRKKEEEQKKQAAATAKQTDKSRPVTSTPIAGTPWCVVWTGDARVFFYNPSTRTSVWDRPEDLMNREDVDKAVNDRPEQLKTEEEKSAEAAEQKTNEESGEELASAVAQAQAQQPDVQHIEPEEEDDEEVIKIGTESESSVEEVPTKRVRMVTKSKRSEDAALEAEQRAAKERALIPLEMRVTQFKEMLREKDVSAFSTWEKELHKIVFDPRYLLLTSKERKQVFEKYVKDRAEEERKEKRNKMRQKRDDFRSLMEEARLHGKSSFSEFSQKNAKEERYRAIEKVRERESLFNEYIVDVRRREKEDKQLKKEQIRKDFLDMLRERHDIERHTRWYDIKKKLESDPRYRIVDSMYREEYFEDYLHIMKEEKRKEREQREQRERERHRERKSDRKDKDKDKDKEKSRKDRGRSRSKDKDRERKSSKDKDKEKDKSKSEKSKKRDSPEEGEHHDESEREERAGSDDSEVARQRESEAEQKQKEREKKLRAEQSIREREKEVQRTLAGHLRDRDKEREHHKRDESIGHFTALLTDLVRTADFTWKEVKRQLRKDHRWEQIEPLDRDDRERIFNVHIDNLMKKKRERFREMLDEISTLQLTSTWKEIKKLVKEDPRYLKYNSEKGEREFKDYIKDKTLQAKTALRELLQECKFITHKSSDLIKENANHLKEIQDILKNDKRYLVLDHLEEERNVIVVGFVEELNKRGPPPPPTASESTRRNK